MKFLQLLLLAVLPYYLLAADLDVSNLRMTSADTGLSNSDGIINYNNPSFAWDANPNALGYQISKDNGTNWIDVAQATTYTFSGLSDAVYQVTVRAYQASTADINIKASDGSPLGDGTTSVSVAQGTDFGSIDVNGGSVVHTFTLENTGTAPLTSAISCSDTLNYALQQLQSPLTGNATFQIAFNPSEAGTYDATITITNNVAGDKNPYTFAIRGVGTGDNDGVDEASGVDGNQDGTDDSEQDSVTTIATGSTQTTISTNVGSMVNVSSSGGGSIDATLSNGTTMTLPYGTVSFTITGVGNGDTAMIELFYPYDESITGYAKQFADGSWHDIGAVVTHSSPDYTKVAFSITDGSEFDLDGLVNGEVKDPGGAYRAGAAATAVSVPLFGLPGVLLLSMLFGLVGLRRIHKS